MSPESAVQLVRQAVLVAFVLSSPLLLAAVLVGLAINLIQVATSMQDTAVSTVPRLAAMLAVFLLALPWMLNRLMTYASVLLADFTRYVR
jgi:flagellar biosynthetic protein FliQ